MARSLLKLACLLKMLNHMLNIYHKANNIPRKSVCFKDFWLSWGASAVAEDDAEQAVVLALLPTGLLHAAKMLLLELGQYRLFSDTPVPTALCA